MNNMKSKLITKVLTLCSKPEKLRELVFRSLHYVHSLLLGGRSSLWKPHSCIFLGSFRRSVWPSALGSRLVYLNAAPALIRRCCSK